MIASRRVVWLTGLCCLVRLQPAEAQHWSFQEYGADQGLTNPTILGLHQDRQGFLWASTEGGLFRYDGDRFRALASDSAVNNRNTNSIHTSLDGQLWTASSAGLFRWNAGAFLPVPAFKGADLESGQAIASDTANLYVASESGLRSLPLHGGSPRLVSQKSSYSVLAASDGAIWFTCGSLLCSWKDGYEQEWGSDRGVIGGPWQSIAEDAAGRLWIRSSEQVLMRESPGSRFRGSPALTGLHSTHGAPLVSTLVGEVVIPHNAGLMICEGFRCRNYGPENGLKRAEVLSAQEDREGSLWIGYSGYGLTRWLGRDRWQNFAEQEGLSDPSVWRIVHDSSGGLWIGTNRGLFCGTQEGGRWHFRRSDVVGSLSVYGLSAEADGSLWIGTFQSGVNGLLRYDPRTGSRRVYRPAQPVAKFSVSEIHRDETGAIWVATPQGVMRLAKGATKLEPVSLPVAAPASDVLPMGEDLFVACSKGLYIQHGQLKRLLTVKDGLKDNAVQSVTAAPDGALWIAYFSPVGITRISLRGVEPLIAHLTTKDGLPSNVVYSHFFDAEGRHWLGTDRGVAMFDGIRWITYDSSDGLVWNDCNAHAYLAERDGSFWVGTSGGLSRFFPAVERKTPLPRTFITSVVRNDVPVQQTNFASDTHSLQLRFTMLSFKRQEVNFRYRIGAQSGPWLQTQSHEVRFAELPPGAHRFEVQGEAAPGVWTPSAAMEFRIQPPWFRAWQFRVCLVLAITFLVAWWWRQRERHQLRIRAELETAVATRTRDLAEATARAERANRAKGEFLANMSHELRTPLNAVLGFTQLLAADKSLGQRQLEKVEIVSRSGEHLLALINDILDISKIEAGKVESHVEAFDLPRFLEDMKEMFAIRCERKGLSLYIETTSELPRWVEGDLGKLRQVVINLVGNAVKFTSDGGVGITVGRDCSRIRFAIVDSGKGIPADEIGLIVQPFTQSSITDHEGGTGLGLAISARFIEMMGGELEIQSEVGKGSSFGFAIELPETDSRPQDETAAEVPIAVKPGSEVTVLIVDDKETNRLVLKEMLDAAGFSTIEARNGREALERALEYRPSIVFMDIRMPEMDGYEAVRLLKERPEGSAMKVFALTASAFKHDEERIRAAGFDGFLAKPFKRAALFQLIRDKTEIEMVYERPSPSARDGSEVPDFASFDFGAALAAAGGGVAERLGALALINDFSGARALADELETASPGLAALVRRAALTFDERGMAAILDALRGAGGDA